jgi:hypothetical protein
MLMLRDKCLTSPFTSAKLRQAFIRRLEIGVCLQEAAVNVQKWHVTGRKADRLFWSPQVLGDYWWR